MKLGIRIILWSLLVGSIGLTLISARSTYLASSARDNMADVTTRSMGLVTQPPKHLAPEFTDSQDRMLADPPATADQLLDPETIVVAHVTGNDTDRLGIDWKKFDQHLTAITGKPVSDQPFQNDPHDLEQIKSGKITLVAIHAPEAPFLVNMYGFQPIAVLGDDSGAMGNHVDIIVPADSPISQPAGLRGHTLVCTTPSSITGYRAAVTLLLHNEHLRPNVDYTVTWSVSQKKSIQGVISHAFGAAAVSDDKLQSLLADDEISESEYRVIYSSEVIPRTTIGCFYNLKPELARKIREAILSFTLSRSPAAGQDSTTANAETKPTASASARHMHFIPVDYKKDFKLVREIDDSFDPRIGAKAPRQPAAPTTAP